MSPRLVPYGQIELLKAEVNRLIDLLLESGSGPGAGWQPAVDMVAAGESVLVQVELPGVTAADLTVEVQDERLVVRGHKRRLPSEPQARRFHLMERFIGTFRIEVELPEPVNPTGAEAELEQGLLTVRLPLLVDKRHQRHQIAVRERGREGAEHE